MSLVAYCDFETTAPTDSCLDCANKKMVAVSYVIIFDFHPKLNFRRIIIELNFGHHLQNLTNVTRDELSFENSKMMLQLKDFAITVSKWKSKAAISEMFLTELNFATVCLLQWFN